MSERERNELDTENGHEGQNDPQTADGPEAVEEHSSEPDFRDKYLRAAAEVDNLLKRIRRDVERARKSERSVVLKAFLDVLDNFDRALAMPGAEGNQWLEGFEATRQQMLETLKRFGATPFDSLGEPFDPHRHDAVAIAHIPDKEDGTVVEVIQMGYEFEDEDILRPAKVVVARNE